MQRAKAQLRAAVREERESIGGRGGGCCWEIVRQRGKWTKEKKKHTQTEYQEVKNETQPSHVFVESPGLMQTVLSFFFFLLTQEGGADVPESRPAVSLFFLLLVCSQLLDVAKALPYSVPAFLFFLRVGLQQEGHLQASPK